MDTPRKHQCRVGCAKSEIVASLPRACEDERAATEFMERWRWNGCPCCPHCGDTSVRQMMSADLQTRNRRFLWRCMGCRRQFTVRVGTVLEDSRIPLRHWVWAFWAASASKKGISSKQVQRQTGLSYKSALFLTHRIRLAMTPKDPPKLTGTVEADEVYIGGKIRQGQLSRDKRARREDGKGVQGRSLKHKIPVFAVVQRGGDVRARVIERVSSANLREAILDSVDPKESELMTDEYPAYRIVGREFKRHGRVMHSIFEYVSTSDRTVYTNTVEGFFSLFRRKLHGTHHSVSKRHLHRYVDEAGFLYNTRKLEDGERTVLAIQGASGKRLRYRQPA